MYKNNTVVKELQRATIYFHSGDRHQLFLKVAMTFAQTDPSTVDIKPTIDNANTFATDLYARLATKPGNLFFSPYSIDSALAMTYAGSAGNTARQMADVMHYSASPTDLPPLYTRR